MLQAQQLSSVSTLSKKSSPLFSITIQAEVKPEQLVLKVNVHLTQACRQVHQSQLMPQQHMWILQLLFHALDRESVKIEGTCIL